jgi:hypothetical protein
MDTAAHHPDCPTNQECISEHVEVLREIVRTGNPCAPPWMPEMTAEQAIDEHLRHIRVLLIWELHKNEGKI